MVEIIIYILTMDNYSKERANNLESCLILKRRTSNPFDVKSQTFILKVLLIRVKFQMKNKARMMGGLENLENGNTLKVVKV